MMKRPVAIRQNAGFTLVETLVAMAVGLAAMAVFLSFNRAQFFAMHDQARQLDIQTTTRAVVDLFAREVRRAGMDPNCTMAFTAVADSSATQVRIRSDLNVNGVLDAASEDITYRIVPDGRLERVVGVAAEVLLDDVDLTGSRIRYFDSAGAELVPSPALTAAQAGTVRRVRIELAVAGAASDPKRTAPLVARAATDVELRNRFFIGAMPCPS